jgi:rhomboid protease GluP
MGVPLVPRMTSGRTRYLRRQKFAFAASAFLLALFGYWISNLK